jgi:hypothetical protein
VERHTPFAAALAAASQTSLLSKFAATVEEPEQPERIINKSSHFILTSLNRVVGEKGYCTTAELHYFVVKT